MIGELGCLLLSLYYSRKIARKLRPSGPSAPLSHLPFGYSPVSEAQRCAVLLLSLRPETSARVFHQLPAIAVEEIVLAISTLPAISTQDRLECFWSVAPSLAYVMRDDPNFDALASWEEFTQGHSTDVAAKIADLLGRTPEFEAYVPAAYVARPIPLAQHA